MSTEQSQKEFEAWATKRGLQLDKDSDAWGREKYKYHMIQALWDGWQASRAALVVELPEGDYHDGDIDCPLCVSVEEVKSILRAAGITVRGE